MIVEKTELPGVVVIEPQAYADDRGAFHETYHESRYQSAGIDVRFVQDNLSRSKAQVLRGLHYQVRGPQAKLVWCTRGAIWDVAVDLREGQPTFGRWVGVELSAENRRQIYVPPGFGHGFCVLQVGDEGLAEIAYKCSTPYDPSDEAGVHWADATLAIDWPIAEPLMSERDGGLPTLDRAVLPRVPTADSPAYPPFRHDLR